MGWVGEPLLARIVEGILGQSSHITLYAHGIAIAVAFILITCLHVILGELVPKSLALQRGEQVALAVAAPMEFWLTLTRPFFFAMSAAAGSVLSVIRLAQGSARPHTFFRTNSSSS